MDSHQFTASVSCKVWTVHADPLKVPQSEPGDRKPTSLNLITLHWSERPSQMSDRDSEEKCCALSGFTVRDAVESKSERK